MKQVEAYWKIYTDTANQHFTKGELMNALDNYKKALEKAEELNRHIPDCVELQLPFIQVFIISCNNLSYSYEELGKLKKAEDLLKRSVYYLLHLSHVPLVDRDELQHELKRASLAYMEFTKKLSDGQEKQQQLIQVIQEDLFHKNFNKPL